MFQRICQPNEPIAILSSVSLCKELSQQVVIELYLDAFGSFILQPFIDFTDCLQARPERNVIRYRGAKKYRIKLKLDSVSSLLCRFRSSLDEARSKLDKPADILFRIELELYTAGFSAGYGRTLREVVELR